MSGWGSGFPGVMGENTQRKPAAENAPEQASAHDGDDDTGEGDS